MTNIEIAKHDPASIFKHPKDVLKDSSITQKDKIDILRRWAYDEREKAVAEEENMTSSNQQDNNLLAEVMRALISLGEKSDQQKPPPTKQG